MIPLARPVIQDLIARGMYLSKAVANKALALVGE
jgi:predicted nucleic acid-binding protein